MSKKSYIILWVTLFLSFPIPSLAQITFERTYGGVLLDEGRCVQQTSDGGYIVAGLTESFGAGGSDVYLVKTDSLGNLLWTRTYGGTANDEGFSVRETSDGGFIVVGKTRSFGAGFEDVYLIKTNSSGDTLWTRTIGGSSWDNGTSVEETSDGGFILVGTTRSFGAGQRDYYLVKTNSGGDTLWTRTFGGTAWDEGIFVEEISDSGFIITGNTRSFGAGQMDLYLVKTDPSGNSQWTRTFGGTANDGGSSVHETSDGGYILSGITNSFGAGFSDIYLIKTNSLGDTTWTKTFGGTNNDEGLSVQENQMGGYILGGWTESFGGGLSDVYLIRTDPSGDTLWTRTFGGTADDRGFSLQETSDGGLILAGWTESYGAGNQDVYLIKTENNGFVGVADGGTLTLDSPGDTVFTDSTYPVLATLRNFGTLPLSFNVVATIDGYADTVPVNNLAAGANIQIPFNPWTVPSPDSFTYTLTVCTRVINDVDTLNDCLQKAIFAYTPVGVEEGEGSDFRFLISDFRLYQNQPNPFHHSTLIRYALQGIRGQGSGVSVKLVVYDLSGRLVETLVDKKQEPGVYQLPVTNYQLPGSGIYFYRLTVGSPERNSGREFPQYTTTRKLILLR